MAAKKLIDFSDKKIAYTMALLNIETGRYKEAKNFFSKLSKDEVHYLSGVIKSKSGKTKEAINLFSKVAVSESKYIHCVYAISEEYIKVRDVKALKEYIKKEVSKNPSRDIKINLYLIESEVLYENKLFSDAYNSVNNALKDFNDSVDLLYTRALVAEKIDRIDILEKDLKMILKDDPNNAQALNALGYTWIEHNKNFVEAKSYIDKALSLLPHDAAILDSKGWALYKEGKYKDSEKYLKKAFKKNKDS
jgi:Putative Zn-dependent protease, contains TPR repeats